MSCIRREIPAYGHSPHGGAVQADGITSANTVGYNTTKVKGGQFYMVGVQLADVASADETADFNTAFKTDCVPGEYGDGNDFTYGNAPMIQVLQSNGQAYDFYYYISDAYDSSDKPVVGNCWADASGYILTSDVAMQLSKGFWFKSETDGSITAAGQVSALNDFERIVPANQFEIVANPYPVALCLNSPTTAGFAPGEYGDGNDFTYGNAPMIQVLQSNGQAYDFYYYISDAYDSSDKPVVGNCWADASGYILNGAQVNVGSAFWIKSATSGKFTFSL